MPADNAAQHIFSVSELNRAVRQLLEIHLPLLWVEGEISNLARPTSGHWYLTLKDDQAQVRCAMFRNANLRVGFRPENGQQVLVRCRAGLYEGRGEYQLIIEHMEEAGLGSLQRKFEQLKQQLASEGLFSSEHKKALPEQIQRIGVITSPSGAAIHDILSVLKRRFPAIAVTLYPVAVQGPAAAGEIVKAVQNAQQHAACDVLIVGRGGGSLEDIWPFNEETVARAIYDCPIPIVSAVGHETDFTIADFVADHRAPTPSAAAELLSPDQRELSARLNAVSGALHRQIQRQLQSRNQQLDLLQRRLIDPGQRLRQNQQHLTHLQVRLQRSLNQLLQSRSQQLQLMHNRLQAQHPQTTVAAFNQQLLQLRRTLRVQMRQSLTKHRDHLQATMHLLHAVSPLATIERGYGVVRNEQGEVVRSVTQVDRGQQIHTQLGDGELISVVKYTESTK